MATLTVHPDRLLPVEPGVRDIARQLYAAVRDLPIVSPHGHVDPPSSPQAESPAVRVTAAASATTARILLKLIVLLPHCGPPPRCDPRYGGEELRNVSLTGPPKSTSCHKLPVRPRQQTATAC